MARLPGAEALGCYDPQCKFMLDMPFEEPLYFPNVWLSSIADLGRNGASSHLPDLKEGTHSSQLFEGTF
jgi:hypothetical protein